ncbi:hypothetical protein JAAARDRAFT_416034 [Jaapia argillacea MUCL 33604]|uniref:mRNA export factor GLE1 n=1 Tax=Jaapia argillacea MUCL 33604 TaxID=933084 RepID=A0A067PG56_9AGAM|nr:hypothetical protein JAAARDRAFT_416034 [Jaapia argillacea MUCL 33604]
MRKAKAEMLKQEENERQTLGLTTAEEDWRLARETLKKLKGGPMKNVKSNKELKSEWGKLRREITPKIGQLTNDTREINRISQQLVDLIRPRAGSDLYYACLSSLAKAILLQCETEVTAEKRSALPLVQATINMLSTLPDFSSIFWAKLYQRAGPWPVPFVIPSTDVDGTKFTDAERRKALGYREEESRVEYGNRLSGIMRLYFLILFANVQSPLDKMFQMQRYWVWFARMLGEGQLLDSSVAPLLMHTGLDVGGLDAKPAFGRQWIKMLGLLYEGVTTGFGGSTERLIGGQTPEGRAARVRVQLQVERIMTSE